MFKYLFWACWTIENNVSLGHFYFTSVFPYIFHFSSRRICYLLWLWNKEQRRRKSEARHKRQRFYPSRNTRCKTRCTPSSAQSRNRRQRTFSSKLQWSFLELECLGTVLRSWFVNVTQRCHEIRHPTSLRDISLEGRNGNYSFG